MRRLVYTSDLAEAQHKELLLMLDRAGIRHSEATPGFLVDGALLVPEADLPRAIDLLRREASRFGQRARREWEREWRMQHKSSYAQWLANRFFRHPKTMIVSLVALGLILGMFVVYPLMYALRAGT